MIENVFGKALVLLTFEFARIFALLSEVPFFTDITSTMSNSCRWVSSGPLLALGLTLLGL